MDGVDRLLDGLGDLALDDLGRRARVRRLDADDGARDVGVLVDGQPLVGDGAQDDERHHEHGGEDGAPDGDVGEDHGVRLGELVALRLSVAGRAPTAAWRPACPAFSPPRICTVVPWPTPATLPTITRSPGSSPASTSATPALSSTRPRFTGA